MARRRSTMRTDFIFTGVLTILVACAAILVPCGGAMKQDGPKISVLRYK